MENTTIFLLLMLMIIVLSVSRAKSYRWTKKKLLVTAIITYVITAVVTFGIL